MKNQSSCELDLIGEPELELQVSVTRGPSVPPVVNVLTIPKMSGVPRLILRLDLPHAQELLERLIGACELIEGDLIEADSQPRQ
jgi:hypothetical protein